MSDSRARDDLETGFRDALDRFGVAVDRARMQSPWKRARSSWGHVRHGRLEVLSEDLLARVGEVRTCGRHDRVA
jgi:hypothetical protein